MNYRASPKMSMRTCTMKRAKSTTNLMSKSTVLTTSNRNKMKMRTKAKLGKHTLTATKMMAWLLLL